MARAATNATVIHPLGADGSVPFDEGVRRRWSDRALLVVIAAASLGLAVLVGGLVIVNGRDAESSAPSENLPAASTTQDGRDLSQVTNEEMETVVAANPEVVPMRLALVERYLRAADGEQTVDSKKAQLERARFHAGEAAARAIAGGDRARATRYLGWTTGLLTDPAGGARLLEQSLMEEPGNPDALWFLATIHFEKLNDPAAAKPLLEQLLAGPMDDAQRQAVQAKLDKVAAALGG